MQEGMDLGTASTESRKQRIWNHRIRNHVPDSEDYLVDSRFSSQSQYFYKTDPNSEALMLHYCTV